MVARLLQAYEDLNCIAEINSCLCLSFLKGQPHRDCPYIEHI